MKRYCLFVSLLFLTIACQEEEKASLSEELDKIFSQYFSPDDPGGAVLIMKEDQILFENGYGVEDINTKRPITPYTLFNTGSISKTFVANGILILNERKELSLDDNLGKYFPGFKNKDLANSITIEHLLSHSSGLPDLRGVRDSIEYYLMADDMQNFKPLLQADSTLFEPGSKFNYSNPGYNGLAVILEKLTGERWQDFIINEIFEPSGMSRSVITDGPFPETGVSHGYVYSEENDSFIEMDFGETPTWNAAGNSGVWSTVSELAFYYLALRDATFLTPATIKQSHTPVVSRDPASVRNNLDLTGMGHSWFIQKTDSAKYVGHTGSQGGFISDFLVIKDKGLFYVLLCNTPVDIFEIRSKVLKVLHQHAW